MTTDFVTNEEIVQEARKRLGQGPWDYLVGASESETTMRRTYKINPYLNEEAARNFYFAMVQSVLSYGILVWGGTSVGSAPYNKLCRLQDKIIFNLFAKIDDTFDNVIKIYKRHRAATHNRQPPFTAYCK